jgi:F1F0 ATPase subunit 2
MNDPAPLLWACLAGVLLAAAFFGGLWWTVRRGLIARRPALWFFASSVLRTGLVMVGFWFVGRGHWERLLACLIGFALARWTLSVRTRGAIHATEPR